MNASVSLEIALNCLMYLWCAFKYSYIGILRNMFWYIWFQTGPTVAMEECIISILIAIARHSPTCANAIMNCERLVQTVVDRFTLNNIAEVQPSKIKSVCLLKVGIQYVFVLSNLIISFYLYMMLAYRVKSKMWDSLCVGQNYLLDSQ